MDICAHAPDSGWYQSWYSKASELYIGRDLIGSWTFARMLLTAASGLYILRGIVGHGRLRASDSDLKKRQEKVLLGHGHLRAGP
ncbi:9614_t:CDS:2 [Rhizophagus irregularis]|nr:9614_t:CDS:2 [Rhizophagus irregularis]